MTLKCTEYKRVIGAPELLFVAGRTLKRQGVKYTAIAALIGIGAMLAEVVGKNELGEIERRAGVMAVVLKGGIVRPGDKIAIELPPEPHVPLEGV